MTKTISLLVFVFFCVTTLATGLVPKSKINPELLNSHWTASWIADPDDSGLEYGVYHFRKKIVLASIPNEFIIHVSADNRYRLFVNGIPVCFGPSRGDLFHWRYESVDISGFLKQGENVLAAVVWNFADKKPWAQHSLRTGFILQGNSSAEEIVNTNDSWKVIKNKAYNPIDVKMFGTFIVVGPGDEVEAAKYPWNWEKADFDDSNWKNATGIDTGRPKEAGTGIDWGLVPREIPLMETVKQPFSEIRRASNIAGYDGFVEGNKRLTIPENSTATLLFDQGKLTTAYPELFVSGGNQSKIEFKYAEALFDEAGNKGNRNIIEGKEIRGNIDIFLPDGGENRLFRPLWLRTWRYLQLTIVTGSEPLILEKFQSEFSAYPFQEVASFRADNATLTDIWNVGWHTARLCAGETYFDCPYYEQLQYVGDTRIQALISLYVSGDDRLMRKAIQVFDDSRFSEGLTMSRYPSSTPQVIPTYSLFWIDMVHDYWMHRDDPEFVKSFLHGIDNVLHFFISKIDVNTGLVGKTGYWNFVDWANEWPWNNDLKIGGVPKGGYFGGSSIISFQLVYSARHAATLHQWAGNADKAAYYSRVANQVMDAVKKNCWDDSKKYFAETPDKKEFSMHAQIFATLTDAIPTEQMQDFVLRFEQDQTLIQPTMYFRFYLTQALKKAGLADKYLETLGLWYTMLEKGLTTFAEKPDPSRSDCHAWSASPNYDFLATVAGIEPAETGFASIIMKPALGSLNEIEGKMPHPKGMISFQLQRKENGGIKGLVSLPGALKGTFIWNNKKVKLGNQTTIDL